MALIQTTQEKHRVDGRQVVFFGPPLYTHSVLFHTLCSSTSLGVRSVMFPRRPCCGLAGRALASCSCFPEKRRRTTEVWRRGVQVEPMRGRLNAADELAEKTMCFHSMSASFPSPTRPSSVTTLDCVSSAVGESSAFKAHL